MNEFIYHTGCLARDRMALPYSNSDQKSESQAISRKADFYYGLYRRGLGYLFQRLVKIERVRHEGRQMDYQTFEYLCLAKDTKSYQQLKEQLGCNGSKSGSTGTMEKRRPFSTTIHP